MTEGPFQIWCDVFTINHDPEYWEDPWTFNPERFLDEQGQLVGTDHVTRRRSVGPNSTSFRLGSFGGKPLSTLVSSARGEHWHRGHAAVSLEW